MNEARTELASLMRVVLWTGFLACLMQFVVVMKQSGILDQPVKADCQQNSRNEVENHSRGASNTNGTGGCTGTHSGRQVLCRNETGLGGMTRGLTKTTKKQRKAHENNASVIEVWKLKQPSPNNHQTAHETYPEIPLQLVEVVEHSFLLSVLSDGMKRVAGANTPVARTPASLLQAGTE